MSLVYELNKKIFQQPSLIQVAIKGIWEDTWDIPFVDGQPSIDAIDHYLKKGTEGIAFEVFFKTDDGYNLILGIRFTEGLVPATPREFLMASFQSIWSMNKPTFASMITDLSKKLTGDPKSLFGIDPTGVELGVINWWKSMGSIEIWKGSESKNINKNVLKEKLEKNSHLLKNNNNYVAMEFNYRVAPHYWIGIQVSDKQDDTWVLNENHLEVLLKDLLHISLVTNKR